MRIVSLVVAALAVLLAVLLWFTGSEESEHVVLEPQIEGLATPEQPLGDRAVSTDRRFDETSAAPASETKGAAQNTVATPQPEVQRIVVRVQDEDGGPMAGVAVIQGSRREGGGVGYATQRTDAHGECTFEIRDADCKEAERGARFFHLLEASIGAPIERAFDPRDPPRDPVLLTVQSGGFFDIVALNELGEVVSGAISIELCIVDDRSQTGAGRSNMFGNRFLRCDCGSARTASLALGKIWRLAVEPIDGSRSAGSAEVAGPTQAGESIEVRIPLGAARPVLLARMIDQTGAALSEQEWAGDLRLANDALRLDSTKSDGEGRVRWPLAPVTERATKLALWLWSPPQHPRWIASRELRAPLARGPVELGDLACAEVGVGVSGTVVDGAGLPLAKAAVAVRLARSVELGALNVPFLDVRTDVEGKFAIRVPEFAPRLDVEASLWGYTGVKLADVLRGAPESVNLRLVLRRGAEIRGTTKHDDPSIASLWRVVLEDDAGDRKGLSFVRDDGSFEFQNLEPGRRYALHFGVQAPTIADFERNDPYGFHGVHVIRDLRVPEAGGACTDPRLKDIDLRGLLMLRRVRVLGLGDEPFANQRVGVAQRSNEGELRSFRLQTDEGGRFRWLGLAAVEALTFAAKGYALELLEPGLAEQTVRLRRGLPIVIELAPEAPEVPAPFELWVMLRHDALPPLWITAFSDRYLDFEGPLRSGRAELFVPGPGTYSVSWMLRRDVGGTLAGSPANVARRDVIDVLEQAAPQTFQKAPHPNGIKAALRMFDRH